MQRNRTWSGIEPAPRVEPVRDSTTQTLAPGFPAGGLHLTVIMHSDGDGTERIAWIAHVDPGEADGELAEAYERIGVRDRVAAILGVQSLHPAAMEAHSRHYREIMFGDTPLSRTEREAIAVVVSTLNDCFY